MLVKSLSKLSKNSLLDGDGVSIISQDAVESRELYESKDRFMLLPIRKIVIVTEAAKSFECFQRSIESRQRMYVGSNVACVFD